MSVASDDTTGASDLRAVVEKDPALATKILRIVNSSAAAARHRVSDLTTAITLLGFKQVRNIAMTIYVSRVFRSEVMYLSYSREDLWNHSVAVASTSRMIAGVCGGPAEEAYVAGLLHDIGLILLDQSLRRYLRKIIDQLDGERCTTEIEREILSFDHAELGEFVALRWELPEQVSAAAGYHHAPSHYEGEHTMTVHSVALANYLCSRHGLKSLGNNCVLQPGEETYRCLGIQKQQMEEIVHGLGESIDFASSIVDA